MQDRVTAEISLFGPNSLRDQLGTQVKADRKFRQMVRNWLKRTKAFWPDCPADMSPDGNSLIMRHGQAIHARQLRVENVSFPRT